MKKTGLSGTGDADSRDVISLLGRPVARETRASTNSAVTARLYVDARVSAASRKSGAPWGGTPALARTIRRDFAVYVGAWTAPRGTTTARHTIVSSTTIFQR